VFLGFFSLRILFPSTIAKELDAGSRCGEALAPHWYVWYTVDSRRANAGREFSISSYTSNFSYKRTVKRKHRMGEVAPIILCAPIHYVHNVPNDARYSGFSYDEGLQTLKQRSTVGKLIQSASNSHSHGHHSAILCVPTFTVWGKDNGHLEESYFPETKILDPLMIIILMQQDIQKPSSRPW
jgi:hypothetical protein